MSMTKVLVIDDSQEVNELIRDTLAAQGFHVLLAEDGLVGVEAAQRHLPDLILCDVNMPKLDGYGTLTALRQHSSTGTIPFIFLTGIADKVNFRQGMELGADDYLTKPFTISELLAAVRARLEKQAAITRQAERKLEELRGNLSMALPKELLSPLTRILDLTGLLMDNCATVRPPDLFELATDLHHSAFRLQRTVENFLLYSQIELVSADEAKVAALRSGEFLISKEDVLGMVRDLAQNAARIDDMTVCFESARLAIARDKLLKIIVELLDNAFKFSKPGTEVALTGTVVSDSFTITIADRGRGMTPDQIARVGAHLQFERKFYDQQGAGLGLVIAKRLAELHGGSFSIESLPERQTTVQVSFPIAVSLAAEPVML
jgi:two-component system, sensor histidine kinase and response regulator